VAVLLWWLLSRGGTRIGAAPVPVPVASLRAHAP
jgi:hypothetical protein